MRSLLTKCPLDKKGLDEMSWTLGGHHLGIGVMMHVSQCSIKSSMVSSDLRENSASLDVKNRVGTLIIPFRGFLQTCNFSGWTSVKSPKVLVLTNCSDGNGQWPGDQMRQTFVWGAQIILLAVRTEWDLQLVGS